MSDSDIDLLEMYLDDAMTPEEAEALRRRVAESPGLSEALSRLRDERAARQAVWQALEPNDVEIGRLIGRVRQSIRHREHWTRRWQVFRIGTAAAACLAFGFFGGWLGRGASPTVDPAGPAVTGVASLPPAGAGNAGHQLDSPGFHVVLTDLAGRAVAVQTFDTPEKAREFVEDVDRMQNRQTRPTGNAILISEEF